MDEIVLLAPDGAVASLMSVIVPLFAAGVGLTLLFWFFGGVWSVVMSVFDL